MKPHRPQNKSNRLRNLIIFLALLLSSAVLHAQSSSVPMDSWIYPALDRLSALGLTPSQFAGLRPWTRLECRRQTLEADEALRAQAGELGESLSAEAKHLIDALRAEFSGSAALVLESISIRNGFIAGPELNDSFHFGQTWINDFGRPFGRGWNSNDSLSVRADAGRWFAAVRAEYQRAPGRGEYSLEVRQLISNLDAIPLQPPIAQETTSRFRTIDAYAGVRVKGMQFSFGKQPLYWGPSYDAPLSFSSNAEPTKNLKIAMVDAWQAPKLFGLRAKIKGEFVVGKLGGHSYTWRPWFNALKVSFKTTDNFEIGFTKWAIFLGAGHPVTLGNIFRNFRSMSSTGTGTFPDPMDPGDRKVGIDFRYRIPGLKQWLTVYSDAYCDADCNHLPRSQALNPGIYVSHLPGMPKLDFRAEWASTVPLGASFDYAGGHIYYNGQYRSGNTNYGNLLGSWVGRDARAIQGWSTYWFSPRNKIEVNFRHLKASSMFHSGGTQAAGKITATFDLGSSVYGEAMFQCERFLIPALGGPHRNASAWLRLTWEPKLALYKPRIFDAN